VFRYKRRRRITTAGNIDPSSNEMQTEVFGQLQRMQVKVSKKPDFVSASAGLALPDVQAMVTRVVTMIQDRKSDIEILKTNVKQIDLADIRWAFETGNCEFLLEHGGTPSRSLGAVRFSDANRLPLIKLARELENRLVAAKEQVNKASLDKEDHNAKLAEMESTLLRMTAEKDTKISKMYEEYQQLEMKLVKAKMDAAQFQMENDNLSSELRKYKK